MPKSRDFLFALVPEFSERIYPEILVGKKTSLSYIMTPIFFDHILAIDVFEISQDNFFLENAL